MDKVLGALPVIAEYSRRLDLAGIIDRVCPVRDVAIVTHGQVIEALVANRLTSPMPMVRVADWAREWAVAETFGITTCALNDDRIARALDAVAPQLEAIVGSVGARAISRFGLESPGSAASRARASAPSPRRRGPEAAGRPDIAPGARRAARPSLRDQ